MSLKKMMNSGFKYITNADYRYLINARFGLYNKVDDAEYLKRMFKSMMQQELDLDNPVTFNQKLQWLKLYYHRPDYVQLVDKYLVREFVAKNLGENYLIPLLGVYDSPDEIDFDKLPDRFVLKCNHNSGTGMCICKDKSKLNTESVKEGLRKGLTEDYYLYGREWPYKNVPRKIICEQYIEDENGQLPDYKFFCFDGKVDNVMVVADRGTDDPKFYHFDQNWHICHYNRRCRKLPDDFTIPKPKEMDKMFEIAARLSKGMPHVRLDFYAVNGHIFFGEFTFFNESGWESGFDIKSDTHLGDLITLPEKIV